MLASDDESHVGLTCSLDPSLLDHGPFVGVSGRKIITRDPLLDDRFRL
jgi:hypothetical protein